MPRYTLCPYYKDENKKSISTGVSFGLVQACEMVLDLIEYGELK